MRTVGRNIGGAVAAFVATPFVVTAALVVIPALPTWSTFVAVIGLAAGICGFRRELRGVAVGMACGAAVHAVALAWLFQSWSAGS